MRKHLKLLAIPAAAIGFGMSLPSCPGQKEMQQQIDSLQTQNTELNKKIQALSSNLNSVNRDMDQVKQILPQITGVIEAQKGALDRIDLRLTEFEKKFFKGKRKK